MIIDKTPLPNDQPRYTDPVPGAPVEAQKWIPVVDKNSSIAIGYYPTEATFTGTETSVEIEGTEFEAKWFNYRALSSDTWQSNKIHKFLAVVAPNAMLEKEGGFTPNLSRIENGGAAYSVNDAPKGSDENPMIPKSEMYNYQHSAYKLQDICHWHEWRFMGSWAPRQQLLTDDFVRWLFTPADNDSVTQASYSEWATLNPVLNGGNVDDLPLTAEDYTQKWYLNNPGNKGYSRNVDKGPMPDRLPHNQYLEFNAQMHFNVQPAGISSVRILRPISDPGEGMLVAMVVPATIPSNGLSSNGGALMTKAFAPALDRRHIRSEPHTGKNTAYTHTKDALDSGMMNWVQSNTIRITAIRHDERDVPPGDYIWPVVITSRSGDQVTVNLTITVPAEGA